MRTITFVEDSGKYKAGNTYRVPWVIATNMIRSGVAVDGDSLPQRTIETAVDVPAELETTSDRPRTRRKKRERR